MKDYSVGIVGGMGSYATVDFFKRLVDAIPAEKEWDRPRIIIDNKCTMPSRVRALLYGEKRDELVAELTDSVRHMMDMGADRIVFACNTSHCFIPDVLKNIPDSEPVILHIIDALGKDLSDRGLRSVGLVATEGTIDSGIYSSTFEPYGIHVTAPTEAEYSQLRSFIEAVKQNSIDDEICRSFISFINSIDEDAVILGCTELPILYKACTNRGILPVKQIYDPLQTAIDIIRSEYSAARDL
jgi:aspartate racemase